MHACKQTFHQLSTKIINKEKRFVQQYAETNIIHMHLENKHTGDLDCRIHLYGRSRPNPAQ